VGYPLFSAILLERNTPTHRCLGWLGGGWVGWWLVGWLLVAGWLAGFFFFALHMPSDLCDISLFMQANKKLSNEMERGPPFDTVPCHFQNLRLKNYCSSTPASQQRKTAPGGENDDFPNSASPPVQWAER